MEQSTDSVLNSLPDGIITFQSDGRILHINLLAQTELHINASVSKKYLSNALFLSDLFSLFHEGIDILPSLLEKIAQGQQEVELPPDTSIQAKVTDTLFPIKGQFFTFHLNGRVSESIFYFHNITNELTQEYIFNTAVNRSKIYPWFLDIDQQIFTLDPRYFEYLGIPAGPGNTLPMETYNAMVHPDDRQALADAFSIQFSGNLVYDKPVPFRLRRGDGRWEWFEGQSSYIGRLSGLPYRLVGICMSIQEHKNIEETLIAARIKAEESDRLKSAFLANMSHEIRTPLNAIVGFSEVLCTTYEEMTPEERQNFVELIKQNSAQLLVLISDILDLSKIESNTMEFHFTKKSLNALLRDIYQEQNVNTHSSAELRLEIPEEEYIITTDPVRLKQVITNLLNNALKFTSEGYVSFGFTLRDNCSVELFVKDTGIGIPQEYSAHIFERFYKIDSFKQGTGLGLSICKTIIEHLQGEITVESVPNQGSTFKISLPNR